MSDATLNPGLVWSRIPGKVWWTSLILVLATALLDPAQAGPLIAGAARALLHTAPFIAFAVLAVAGIKATGAETLLARAFEGPQLRMIVLAAMLGGLSPFCSCEVIPFIAALLAIGAPLSAVMAFWLASPLMDPAMFAILSGTLGPDFALAKAASAVGIGLLGGLAVMAAGRTALFNDPLREQPARKGCAHGPSPFSGRPEWRFWRHADRRATFRESATDNALFLTQWLLMAYLLEGLMMAYVPADWIATFLGGDGVGTIVLGAAIGAPAYLNGYAAVPLVDALLAQGMAPGAAMSFMIAGGVSSIPAAVAVWALVRPRVFAAYIVIGFAGAVLAGLGWAALA